MAIICTVVQKTYVLVDHISLQVALVTALRWREAGITKPFSQMCCACAYCLVQAGWGWLSVPWVGLTLILI